jgi:hypothetical protein
MACNDHDRNVSHIHGLTLARRPFLGRSSVTG